MIIGLCGHKQHGKTSVATMLEQRFGFVSISFADGVRAMAEAINPYIQWKVEIDGVVTDTFKRYKQVIDRLGYEEAKKLPDVRQLLQRIGTEGARNILGPNVWVDSLIHRLDTKHADTKNIVIPDVRFPNEALAIEELGGYLLRVVRTGVVVPKDLHESERHQENFDVAFTLSASDLTQLATEVSHVARELGLQQEIA